MYRLCEELAAFNQIPIHKLILILFTQRHVRYLPTQTQVVSSDEVYRLREELAEATVKYDKVCDSNAELKYVCIACFALCVGLVWLCGCSCCLCMQLL